MEKKSNSKTAASVPQKKFASKRGVLYQGDCISLMNTMKPNSVDLIFADPPFNLNKSYESKIDDNLQQHEYLKWQETWLAGCVKVLKEGGALFVWNLPKWNTYAAAFLNNHMTFRHWIAVDIKYRLPIQGRLYPSHYSLLYYIKGKKANTFHPDRLPMEVCPKCATDLKDYGGYKDKMNPQGVNLSDVWYDIPPVRHAKYKGRSDANELSVKLLDRIIEMASDKDDLIFDPFGGAGTTYVVAEAKDRNWIGIEIGSIKDIELRFKRLTEIRTHIDQIRLNYNSLFTEKTLEQRIKNGLWTCESVRERKKASKKLEIPLFA